MALYPKFWCTWLNLELDLCILIKLYILNTCFHPKYEWLTPVRSTPVRAWMAGGRVPTSLLTSCVVLSDPPMRTISSVLARGADTSAAIWKKYWEVISITSIFEGKTKWGTKSRVQLNSGALWSIKDNFILNIKTTQYDLFSLCPIPEEELPRPEPR